MVFGKDTDGDVRYGLNVSSHSHVFESDPRGVRGGAWGRRSGDQVLQVDPRVGTSTLTRGQRAGSLFPQVRTQQEGAINRRQPRWHPDLGHLVSRTVRNKGLCFISHQVWHFVTAAPGD